MYKEEIERLSKKITGKKMQWDYTKPLTESQQLILLEQMKRFEMLKNQKIDNNEYSINADGKLILEQGTLLHGIRGWTLEQLKEIKNTGILSCEFSKGIVEDAETFYSADFWRIEKDVNMQEYAIDCVKEKKAESDFLPIRKFDKNNKIAFIINSNNNNIQKLLSYDAFRETSSELSKSIISEEHRNNREYMKGRLSAILFGIPSSAFSGIMVGKRLNEEDPEQIEAIKKIFPNLYIVTQEGDFIHTPEKEISIMDNYKEGVQEEITLSSVVKNALVQGTTASQVYAANRIEQSERNPEYIKERETKDN